MRIASLILSVFIFLGLLFTPNFSHATLTITSVAGAYSALDTSSGFTVYAGVSGTDCTGGAAIDTSCNNCPGIAPTTAAPAVCNGNYVGITSRLWINFTSTHGGPMAAQSSNGGGTLILEAGSTTTVAPGATGVLIIKWGNICPALYSGLDNGSCGSNGGTNNTLQGQSIKVTDGTDTAVTPINIITQFYDPTPASTPGPAEGLEPACATAVDAACDFSLFPGDEKIYITGVSGVYAGYPTNRTNGGIGFQSLRLYYLVDPTGAKDCSGVQVSNVKYDTPFQDVGVTAGPPVATTTSYISNFTNGVNYCFLAASIDKAMNVGFLTQTFKPVQPAEVIGILTKDSNCFIATAAYGSALDPHVQTFRDFRGKYLMNTSWGRKFVHWYYQHAPYWAQGIEQDEQARAQVRFFLWPLYMLTSLLLIMPPLKAFVLLMVLAAGSFGIVNRKRLF